MDKQKKWGPRTLKKSLCCDEYGNSFSHKGNLVRHKNIVHKQKKLFSCRECDKCFARSDYLTKQILMHLVDRENRFKVQNEVQRRILKMPISAVHMQENSFFFVWVLPRRTSQSGFWRFISFWPVSTVECSQTLKFLNKFGCASQIFFLIIWRLIWSNWPIKIDYKILLPARPSSCRAVGFLTACKFLK